MKIQIPQPNIPILEKPLIAVKVDLKKKNEHVVIGEFDDVNQYLRGWNKGKIIFEEIRPIGSFLLDIKPRGFDIWDLTQQLCLNTCKKPYINTEIIENFYSEGNPVMMFITMKLWNEYIKVMEKLSDRKYKGNANREMNKAIQEVIFPLRYGVPETIFKLQNYNYIYPLFSINPLSRMPYEYYKYPVQKILVPNSSEIAEYIISDNSILPMIVGYMQTICEAKKYLNYCKVCGKLFLSTDLNKNIICSDKCRKVQRKKNKQKFDDATRDVDYEKTYRNENMYWYN